MVKVSQLKEGDVINVIDSGQEREGIVREVSRDENQALVDNGVQEFWYSPESLHPLPITDERLVHILGFEKEETPQGIKYKKGPFRVLVQDPGNYTNLEIWYREDRRHFSHPIYIHELQNHHLDMVKVPLTRVETA